MANQADRHSVELASRDLAGVADAGIQELIALYDTASAVAFAWNGGITQPRSGEGVVATIMEGQYSRAFYLKRGIARELCRRALSEPLSRNFDCARVLLDWHYHCGGDDDDMLPIARLLCQDKEACADKPLPGERPLSLLQ